MITDEVRLAVNAMSSQAIAAEEASIGNFTRRKLKKLSAWPLWEAGEHKQLNHFENLQMYGKPVAKPKNAIALRPHWRHVGEHAQRMTDERSFHGRMPDLGGS